MFINLKEKNAILPKSGLHKLECEQSSSVVYIGQTRRNFEMRYKKHLSAFRNKHQEKYNFPKYLSENILPNS